MAIACRQDAGSTQSEKAATSLFQARWVSDALGTLTMTTDTFPPKSSTILQFEVRAEG